MRNYHNEMQISRALSGGSGGGCVGWNKGLRL